jgi:hypothetical protein
LFVGVPYFIGFFPVAILRFRGRKDFRTCLQAPGLVLLLIGLFFLFAGVEGLICMIMALPLAAPMILLGAWLAYLLMHRSAAVAPAGGAALVLMALGGVLWAESKLRRMAPTYTVSDAVAIAASTQVVWDALVGLEDLGQPQDLMFRAGIACPLTVNIYGRGEGALRVCTLTTGELHERITVWEPARLMRWVSLSTPPPLKELNPFRETNPPHLHGFYRSVDGQFELRAIGSDSTLVTRSSSYQHNLYPAAYWRLWCDYVASRGHLHVLSVLKQESEREVRAMVSRGD